VTGGSASIAVGVLGGSPCTAVAPTLHCALTTRREPGVGFYDSQLHSLPHKSWVELWSGGSVSWRAVQVPRGLFVLVAARHSVARMAEANGAKRRAVPSQLLVEARRSARRTAGASGAKKRGASMPGAEGDTGYFNTGMECY
jgi:hypothetical protein